MFLWHFPSSRPDRTLSCTLPDGARTFLGTRVPRRPGALRASDATGKPRSPQARQAPRSRDHHDASRNSERWRERRDFSSGFGPVRGQIENERSGAPQRKPIMSARRSAIALGVSDAVAHKTRAPSKRSTIEHSDHDLR